MKKVFGNLVLVAIALAVVSFFAAPAVAFFGIRSAAQSDDVAGLQRLIDFDAVRASLRPQLSGRPEAMTPPPSFMNDPIGAFRRQFEEVAAPQGPNPDAYLTPDAIDGLTRAEGRYAAVRAAAAGDGRGVRALAAAGLLGHQPRADGGDGRGRVGHGLHLRAQGPVRVEAGPHRPA